MVLPTLPVTATIFARLRAREAAASRVSPASVSSTTSTGPGIGLETSAAAAPLAKASATKSCPSRASCNATNKSPGTRLRVSILIPVTATPGPATPKAAESSPASQSTLIRPPNSRMTDASSNGNTFPADDLPLLMALTGHDQHIAGT